MLSRVITALFALVLSSALASAATRTAAIATRIGAGVETLATSGYATAGDLGAATYKRDVSLTTCGFQSADGAFWDLAEPVVNPAMCGAIPDDGIDDTAAITAALSYATTNSKPLLIPNGTFVVSGSGSAIFTVTKPIQITGRGYFSVIQVAAGVPATRDIFLYTSTADAIPYTFALFRDFRIVGSVAGVGRHGINITTLNNGYIFRFGVERMEFANLAGYGVWADQSAVNTAVHTSWIRDSHFTGNGFGGVSLYDSWVLDNNRFTGTGYAVNITSISGAGKFTLQNGSVTASSGVKIGGSAGGPVNLLIDNVYFETLSTYDGDCGAYVCLLGASGSPLLAPMVTRSIFTILSGKGDPHGLKLDYTVDPVIAEDWFNVVPVVSYCVFATANAVRTRIHPTSNIYNAVGAGKLSNSGTLAHVSPIISALTADSTSVTNVAIETRYDKILTIPANTLSVGDVIRLRAWGLFSIDAAGNVAVTHRVYIGGAGAGTQVVASGITHLAGLTNNDWLIEGDFIVRALGSSGALKPGPFLLTLEGVNAGVPGVMLGLTASTITFNTTVDRNIELSVAPASARVGDSFKITGATLTIITPDKVAN